PFAVRGDDLVALAATEQRVRRALAMRAELGEPATPADVELHVDPDVAAFQLAAIAPLGPLDQQRVLGEEAPGRFIALLDALVAEAEEALEARLRGR
ncbi:MAG TPA: hypothetical protein VMU14_16485, partial [Acidimicrobiales bacterium]|nr:hypothetical protein [Acidimicrobiales bacterium]